MTALWIRSGPVAALAVALAVAFTVSTSAAPLDPQTCEQLQLKLDGLRSAGVEADMALGPVQAKSTLPAERLSRIGAFIETEEQLNFRCGLAKQRIVLPTTIEGGEEEVPSPIDAAAESAPGALPLPQRAPRAAKEAAASKAGPATKARAPGAKVPAEGTKRRPVATKAERQGCCLRPCSEAGGNRGRGAQGRQKEDRQEIRRRLPSAGQVAGAGGDGCAHGQAIGRSTGVGDRSRHGVDHASTRPARPAAIRCAPPPAAGARPQRGMEWQPFCWWYT